MGNIIDIKNKMVTPIIKDVSDILFERTNKCLNAFDDLSSVLNRGSSSSMVHTNSAAYAYDDDSFGVYSDEDWNDLRDYWRYFGYTCSDEEWEEYKKLCCSMEDEIPLSPNTVLKMKNKDKKKDGADKKGKLNSQKFINGIEVDDVEFESYNKKMTRRGGKKHKKGKNKGGDTYYEYEDWDDAHFSDQTTYANEIKSITFYKRLNNTADVYKWDSLHAFNEWCEENDITVDKSSYNILLYYEESHCCLNLDNHDKKELIVERSYGELVWEITGGDEATIEQYSYDKNFAALSIPQ